MKKLVLKTREIIRTMANGFLDERIICPLCGEPKEVKYLTCGRNKCRKRFLEIKERVMKLKMTLEPHFYEVLIREAKERLAIQAVWDSPDKFLAFDLAEELDYIQPNVYGDYPYAVIVSAVEKARERIISEKALAEERELTRKQWRPSALDVVRVACNDRFPLYAKILPKLLPRLSYEDKIIGADLLGEFCGIIRQERNQLWRDEVYKDVLVGVQVMLAQRQTPAEIRKTKFWFRGQAVEQYIVKSAVKDSLESWGHRGYNNVRTYLDRNVFDYKQLNKVIEKGVEFEGQMLYTRIIADAYEDVVKNRNFLRNTDPRTLTVENRPRKARKSKKRKKKKKTHHNLYMSKFGAANAVVA